MKRFLVLCLFGFIATGVCFAADTKQVTMNEEQLREFVKQVIKDNPKLMYETITEFVRKEQEQKQREELESSFQNRTSDSFDAKNPSKGPENAKITIIEYTDFQCPYCERASSIMHSILEKMPDKIKLIFKNDPLDFHKEAKNAACAGLAAYKQGKFWEYHDLLFQNSSELNEDKFVQFAKSLNLDMNKFNTDRKSEAIVKQVDEEKARAQQLGITGTPAFIINGVRVNGAKPLEYFMAIIERLMNEAQQNQNPQNPPQQNQNQQSQNQPQQNQNQQNQPQQKQN